jgi:hypothetical protein
MHAPDFRAPWTCFLVKGFVFTDHQCEYLYGAGFVLLEHLPVQHVMLFSMSPG